MSETSIRSCRSGSRLKDRHLGADLHEGVLPIKRFEVIAAAIRAIAAGSWLNGRRGAVAGWIDHGQRAQLRSIGWRRDVWLHDRTPGLIGGDDRFVRHTTPPFSELIVEIGAVGGPHRRDTAVRPRVAASGARQRTVRCKAVARHRNCR
jgi:hypothetical protein